MHLPHMPGQWPVHLSERVLIAIVAIGALLVTHQDPIYVVMVVYVVVSQGYRL